MSNFLKQLESISVAPNTLKQEVIKMAKRNNWKVETMGPDQTIITIPEEYTGVGGKFDAKG